MDNVVSALRIEALFHAWSSLPNSRVRIGKAIIGHMYRADGGGLLYPQLKMFLSRFAECS